jgi:iron complex transport system substrate-binding protein
VAGARRRRVLALEWLAPLMPGGHWVPEMVELAGGENVPLEAGEPSRKVPWPEMQKLDPEVIVLMPCGFNPQRAADEASVLWELEGWTEQRAVRQGEVYAVDGNALFSRPGPRLVDGIEVLAAILHPDRCRLPPGAEVLKLVSPPADGSTGENRAPRFESRT